MTKESFRELVAAWYNELKCVGYEMRPLRRITFLRGTRRLGCCIRHSNGECTLCFSDVVVRMCETDEGYDAAKEIILHELCHAIEAVGRGHGSMWKAYARELSMKYGVHITRLVATEYVDEVRNAALSLGKYKYHITCPCGCVDIYKTRKTKMISYPSRFSCKKCGQKIIVENLRVAG